MYPIIQFSVLRRKYRFTIINVANSLYVSMHHTGLAFSAGVLGLESFAVGAVGNLESI